MAEKKKFHQRPVEIDAGVASSAAESSAACLNLSIPIPDGLTSDDVIPVMVVLGARGGKVLVIAPEGVEVAGLAREILQHESQATDTGEGPVDDRPPPGALFH